MVSDCNLNLDWESFSSVTREWKRSPGSVWSMQNIMNILFVSCSLMKSTCSSERTGSPFTPVGSPWARRSVQSSETASRTTGTGQWTSEQRPKKESPRTTSLWGGLEKVIVGSEQSSARKRLPWLTAVDNINLKQRLKSLRSLKLGLADGSFCFCGPEWVNFLLSLCSFYFWKEKLHFNQSF